MSDRLHSPKSWWLPWNARIQRIMRSDTVDAADRRLARMLQGLASAYGIGIRLRTAAYRRGVLRRHKLPCRVISVGNIAVGGTGKTPMALYVAREVEKMGYRTALISRGYHGGAENAGGVVSDGRTLLMEVEQAGDEPFMLALLLKSRRVPVLVGRDRISAGKKALRHFAPEVLVLDDGFQHLRLCRDTDLVLLDEGSPLGNGHLLPRGVLREPPQALRRCHALILTAASEQCRCDAERKLGPLAPGQPRFRARMRTYIHAVREPGSGTVLCGADRQAKFEQFLRGKSVFGFSGIARNDRFRAALQNAAVRLEGFLEFPDHHRYSREDLRRICRASSSVEGHWLATTLKDYVRIQHRLPGDIGVIVLGVRVDFGNQRDRFRRFLQNRLQ